MDVKSSAIALLLSVIPLTTGANPLVEKKPWELGNAPLISGYTVVEDWLTLDRKIPLHEWEHKWLALDRAVLMNLRIGDVIELESLHQTYSFQVSHLEQTDSQITTVTARDAANSNEFIIMTIAPQFVFGTLVAKSGTYSVRGLDESAVMFAEHLPRGTDTNTDLILSSISSVSPNINDSLDSDSQYPLTLGMYYNSEFELSEIEPRMRHLASLANEAFSQSDTNLYISDVIFEPVDGIYNYLASALSELRFPPANTYDGLGKIPEHRRIHGIDFAFYVGERDLDNTCSAQVDSLGSAYPSYKFVAAVAFDCDDAILTTAMGKNYGLKKSRAEFEFYPSDDYRFAYGVDGVFYTLMVENEQEFSFRGSDEPQSIFRFSNPDQLCFDLPCGVPKGDDLAADSASWLRENAEVIATTTEPTKGRIIDFLDSVDDPQLRACIEDYSSTTVWVEDFHSLDCSLDAETAQTSLQGLEEFTYLTTVNLTGLKADLDIGSLNKLVNLEVLTISSVDTGHDELIRLKTAHVLSQLINLRRLSLHFVGLDDVNFLTDMKSLKDFEFISSSSDNYFGLSGATGLNLLSLEGSNFKYSELLNPLILLNGLTLTNTPIIDLDGLSRMNDLTWVTADGVDIADVDGIAHLESLERVSFQDASLSNVSAIGTLATVREIYLSNTPVNSIESFGGLGDLEVVDISQTQVKNAESILLPLKGFSELNDRSYVINLPSTIYCWQRDYAYKFDDVNKIKVQIDISFCDATDDNNDYDGDGKSNTQENIDGTDPFRAEEKFGSTAATGLLDIDGDGKADIFVRNTDTFYNYGLASADAATKRLVFGKGSEDIPLFGDFDGDGKTDIAMRRPSTYMWYVLNSSDPGERGDYIQRIQFGLASEDIPVPSDYDGDGKTDFAVYRPSTKMWYILTSSGEGGERGDGILRVYYGLNDGDIPVTGDFDGDGKADIAVRRPSTQTWHIMRSSDGQEQVIRFGLAEEDIPVPADYDGDGITDLAVRRPSTQMWYILNSSGEPGPYGDGIQRIRFGLDPADIPIVDDYDGDGKADIAVRRPRDQMQYILTSSGEGGDRGDGIMRVRFGLQKQYVPFQAPIHIRMQMVEANNQ